eukprot:908016-Pelagomonas_calceolata.AAC.4
MEGRGNIVPDKSANQAGGGISRRRGWHVQKRQAAVGVRIEWQGVPNPQASDLIGLWVGQGDVDPRHAVPVHYANCSLLNPAYLSTGSGSSRLEGC